LLPPTDSGTDQNRRKKRLPHGSIETALATELSNNSNHSVTYRTFVWVKMRRFREKELNKFDELLDFGWIRLGTVLFE